MGPHRVVALTPIVADRLDLTQGGEEPGVEHFVAVGPIEPLNERIVIGLAGLDVVSR